MISASLAFPPNSDASAPRGRGVRHFQRPPFLRFTRGFAREIQIRLFEQTSLMEQAVLGMWRTSHPKVGAGGRASPSTAPNLEDLA